MFAPALHRVLLLNTPFLFLFLRQQLSTQRTGDVFLQLGEKFIATRISATLSAQS